MKLLVCTDGTDTSIQSTGLVLKIGFPKDTRITVLGVSENIDHLETITAAMDQINLSLGSNFILDRKIRNGDPLAEIMSEAIETAYDLVVVGGGRSQLDLLHPKLGSTTSKLARKLHSHFLVARNIPPQITNVLFCAGNWAHTGNTMKLGGTWISNISPKVTILHVLSSAETSDTKAKNVIKQASHQLHNAGVISDIEPRIRRGLVVEEVLKELADGPYELLVVGAHYQPGQDRWQGTLLDDVTDQLLNKSNCSVLII